MGWFHTDYSQIDVCAKLEQKMWNACDYAVNVSEKCKEAYDKKHIGMRARSIVMENILFKTLIMKQAAEHAVTDEMPLDGCIRVLSVGRFSAAKNFENIPDICRCIRKSGLNIKWYIIGYGCEEQSIRKRIKAAEMEEFVIILGKKENPYPYIQACDIYIQPSRYEGKCVAVREAQILNRPVIITNFPTSANQLRDGYDGVIVPMDNENCAAGIIKVLQDKKLQEELSENTKQNDYTNAAEVEKLYKILGIRE